VRHVGLTGRVLLAGILAVGAAVLVGGAAQAAPKGAGTMLVRQDVHCGGTGNASSVYLPFALYFTGFAPNTVGTVSAYTQPGGHLVASRAVTLDAQGARCVEVVGSATPGQYKIVYEFGSGAGKQKVIQIVPGPTATASASPSHPIATVSPSTTATASPSHPIATVAPSTTATASPSHPIATVSPSTTGTPTSPATPSVSATATTTGSPGATATASPSPSTSESGDLEFIPEYLPPTGGPATSTLPAGLVLLAVGGLLVLASRRGSASTGDRRH